MSGVKGRSGGPRANSGGARKGAGRKPKAQPEEANVAGLPSDSTGERKDPLQFLEDVVNDPTAPLKDRIRAAVAAAQYKHTKRHDGGKLEEAQERAEKAAKGRFGVRPPPLKLVGNG